MIEAEFEEIEGEGEGDELDLSSDDSLPWLEADEEDEAAGGVDTSQVIGFALILITILVGVVGAVWFFGNRATDGDVVADGSTIEAPDGPVKVRPEDPGGKEFDGTGNVAPVVGEGGTREGVLDTDDPASSPDDQSQATPEPVVDTSGVGVQIAAYRSRERAEQGWRDVSGRTDALNGVRYRIERGTVDIGTVYRLKAVASDRAAADRLCAALKADGIDCQVKP
ncbi:MAG: SPOR domain-containing protein [Erythrobacter sp.]